MASHTSTLTCAVHLTYMPTHKDILIDAHEANRDANIQAARKAKARGYIPLAKRHVSIARRWNNELVKLKRYTS